MRHTVKHLSSKRAKLQVGVPFLLQTADRLAAQGNGIVFTRLGENLASIADADAVAAAAQVLAVEEVELAGVGIGALSPTAHLAMGHVSL